MSLDCQACGHNLESSANFCSACGTKQTESATHWRTTADADLHAARVFAEDTRQRTTDSTLGATIAKGAAIGAVAAIPIPFVGPITGAIVGAGIAAYTKLKVSDGR